VKTIELVVLVEEVRSLTQISAVDTTRFRASTVHLLDLHAANIQSKPGVKWFNDIYGDRIRHQHHGSLLGDELIGFDNGFDVESSEFRDKWWPLEMVVNAAIVECIENLEQAKARARRGYEEEEGRKA